MYNCVLYKCIYATLLVTWCSLMPLNIILVLYWVCGTGVCQIWWWILWFTSNLLLLCPLYLFYIQHMCDTQGHTEHNKQDGHMVGRRWLSPLHNILHKWTFLFFFSFFLFPWFCSSSFLLASEKITTKLNLNAHT